MRPLRQCFVKSAILSTCLGLWSACAASAPGEAASEALIDAPPAAVWKALTTREGAESWMVAKAEIDLRNGGLMRTHYSKDGVLGDDGTIENMFLSLDPGRMYSMRIARPPANFPFKTAWQSVWTVVYLEPVSSDKTKVLIRMLGYTDEEESQKMRTFFLRGNQYTLDKLAAKFRKTEDAAQAKGK